MKQVLLYKAEVCSKAPAFAGHGRSGVEGATLCSQPGRAAHRGPARDLGNVPEAAQARVQHVQAAFLCKQHGPSSLIRLQLAGKRLRRWLAQ